MKVYTDNTAVTPELTRVTCNMCGRGIEKNELGYFNDYLSVEKKWGYHSNLDGESHEIDVCLDCYQDWVSQFTIPPGKTEVE
jgi:hypothetical protein